MTVQEMIAEIPHLSHEERLALLAVLHRSLRQEFERSDSGPLLSLRGALKPERPLPDTYDYNEEYANHLYEKYR